MGSFSVIAVNNNEYIMPLSQTLYGFSCALPGKTEVISINFLMVWDLAERLSDAG